MRVTDLSESILLSQKAQILKDLEKYNLKDLTPRDTPMVHNFFDELHANGNQKVKSSDLYRKPIGILLFYSTRTRPDITCSVNILSQYVSRPTQFLLKSVKRVFTYLSNTAEFGHMYQKCSNQELQLEFWSDHNFVGDNSDRKSRSGWIGMLNNCTFIWKSRKQTGVSLSTTEAEYIALSCCSMDVQWIRQLMTEIGFDLTSGTIVYGDNNASISWANELVCKRKAKHVEVKYHFVRQLVQNKQIQSTVSNQYIADEFSKPLNKIKFQEFQRKLGVALLN